MDKQTYTQRVQALAEKMAEAVKPKQWYTCFRERGEIAAQFLPAARIAVAEMADMAKCLYHSRFVREGYSNDKAQEYTQKELKYQGLIPDNEPDILPMQPGEPGYGGYNPDNPPQYDEDMPIVCPSCLMANITIGTNGNCLCNECNEQFKIEQ